MKKLSHLSHFLLYFLYFFIPQASHIMLLSDHIAYRLAFVDAYESMDGLTIYSNTKMQFLYAAVRCPHLTESTRIYNRTKPNVHGFCLNCQQDTVLHIKICKIVPLIMVSSIAKKPLYPLLSTVHNSMQLSYSEGLDFDTVVAAALRDLPAEKTKAVRFWARLYHRATMPDDGGPLDPDDSDEDCAVDDEPCTGVC